MHPNSTQVGALLTKIQMQNNLWIKNKEVHTNSEKNFITIKNKQLKPFAAK